MGRVRSLAVAIAVAVLLAALPLAPSFSAAPPPNQSDAAPTGYGPLAAGTVTANVYLPLIVHSLPPTATATATATATSTPTATATPNTGWTTLLSEDFEGAFPGQWDVFDNNGADFGEYYWAKRDCKVYAGSYSGWAVGGSPSSSLACGALYPDNADSWMTRGPFSLAGANAAELNLYAWFNTPTDEFGLCLMASTNDVDYVGYCYKGSSGGWIPLSLDLTDPVLGDLMGKDIYVGVMFVSDGSGTMKEGAYVDDIVLRKGNVTGLAPRPAQVSAPDGMVAKPAALRRAKR